MKSNRLENFLCCFQLETGGLIIAITGIVGAIIVILISIAGIALNANDMLDQTIQDLGYQGQNLANVKKGKKNIQIFSNLKFFFSALPFSLAFYILGSAFYCLICVTLLLAVKSVRTIFY